MKADEVKARKPPSVEYQRDYAVTVLRVLVSSPTLPDHNRIVVRDALARLDRWETGGSKGHD